MVQSNEIFVDDKRYILPNNPDVLFKIPALKMPEDGKWYIYFNVWDFVLGKWKPVKYYPNYLNSAEAIKKPNLRKVKSGYLVDECLAQLQKGINPQTSKAISPFSQKQLKDILEDAQDSNPTPPINEAIDIYIADKSGLLGKQVQAENKENTAYTYKYFFNQFLEYCKEKEIEQKRINKLQRHHVGDFLDSYYNAGKWSNQTYNNNLGYIKGFVNYFAKKYDFKNYAENIEKKEVLEESERFEPFSLEQLTEIFKFLDSEHTVIYPHYVRTMPADNFLALVSRTILYTFLRPSELRRLKIKHIKRYKEGFFDLTVDITKNKKRAFNELYIEPCLIDHYQKLGWEKYFDDKAFDNYYVFTPDLVPSLKKSSNYQFSTSFTRLLKKLHLDKQNYSLYSLKHTGNILAHKAGFNLTQIQLQNRHTTIEQTETYLRALRLEINQGERPIRPSY